MIQKTYIVFKNSCNLALIIFAIKMKYLNYLLILIGAVVAIYAKVEEKQNQFILIGGIVVLMIGIYRVSKTIPSKKHEGDDSEKLDD